MSDYYDNKLEKREPCYKACFWSFIGIVIGVIIAACLSSCKSVQYVPVETIRTEVKQVHDTVKIHDSIKHEKQLIIREADTAEIERLNTEYGFRLDKAQKTILVLRRELEKQSHSYTEAKDSIIYRDKEVQVPYPVERKLSKWEQIKIDMGDWLIGFVIISSLIFCIYFARGKVSRD